LDKLVELSEGFTGAEIAAISNRAAITGLKRFVHGESRTVKEIKITEQDLIDAIQKVRELAGKTNPEEADPRSIRGAYGRITTSGIYENVIHASANPEEAEREIKLWFCPEDLVYHIYPVRETEIKKAKQLAWA